MGQRGPARKSTKAKKQTKTKRKDRRSVAESVPAGVPAPPDWLGELARQEWVRCATELVKHGLIAEIDRTTFAAYCQAWEEFRQAYDVVQKEGYTTVTDKGNVIQHPAVGVLHRAQDTLLRLGRQFGLTPMARASIGTTEKEDDDDPLSELTAKRAG